jgi:ABC-type histidine transport system ATPase subunit
MAKKVIATLKTGAGATFTRCIKMVKSPKTGAYITKQEIVNNDHIKDFFAEK